jgi:hypothetical protein
MDASPFSNLSPELRNKVYEYSLQQEQPILIKAYSTPKATKPEHRTNIAYPLGLTQSCREIRTECTKLFYAINTFTILVGDIESKTHVHRQFESFRTAIGCSNASLISSVVFEIEPVPVGSLSTMEDDLDKLFGFLRQVATEHVRKEWSCNFRAKASIVDKIFVHTAPQVFMLDVDFADLQGSFTKTFNAVKSKVADDNRLFAIIATMIFDGLLKSVEIYIATNNLSARQISDRSTRD